MGGFDRNAGGRGGFGGFGGMNGQANWRGGPQIMTLGGDMNNFNGRNNGRNQDGAQQCVTPPGNPAAGGPAAARA